MENGKAITLAAKHAVRRYSNHYDEWSENNSSVRKKMWVPDQPVVLGDIFPFLDLLSPSFDTSVLSSANFIGLKNLSCL